MKNYIIRTLPKIAEVFIQYVKEYQKLLKINNALAVKKYTPFNVQKSAKTNELYYNLIIVIKLFNYIIHENSTNVQYTHVS